MAYPYFNTFIHYLPIFWSFLFPKASPILRRALAGAFLVYCKNQYNLLFSRKVILGVANVFSGGYYLK
jgi:hypothetical protein